VTIERSRLIELAGSHGFSDIAEHLAGLALPALRLVYLDEAPDIGASKLGGRPDLPQDVPWPHFARDSGDPEPMTFFGQIALADLDLHVWPGPRDGLLSFFSWQSPEYYGVDAGGAGRVLYLPSDRALAPRDAPDALGADFRLGEAAVVARPELTLPTIAVSPAKVLAPFGFGWDEPRYAKEHDYWALEDELAAEQGFAGDPYAGRPPVHRLLGWPRHVQNDVLPEIVLSHLWANDVDYEVEDPYRQAPDWRLLLQVESDRRVGASFGDGGTLFFGLPATDLAAGRFDRVQAASQCG
jgi:hypothetical protein